MRVTDASAHRGRASCLWPQTQLVGAVRRGQVPARVRPGWVFPPPSRARSGRRDRPARQVRVGDAGVIGAQALQGIGGPAVLCGEKLARSFRSRPGRWRFRRCRRATGWQRRRSRSSCAESSAIRAVATRSRHRQVHSASGGGSLDAIMSYWGESGPERARRRFCSITR